MPKLPVRSRSETITFGCRLNAYESQHIQNTLQKMRPRGAVVFNTCAVTAEAERQAEQAIRRFKREQPDAFVVVTGCSAQLNPERFSKMKQVDLVLGNREKMEADFLQKETGVFVGNMETPASSAVMDSSFLFEGVRGFLQIQNGCEHACTFCTITHARGDSQSVPLENLVSQVKQMVARGTKEITLTGVDLTAYGQDLPMRPSLGEVTSALLEASPELRRLRISSLDPAEIDDHLLEILIRDPRLLPHIHISLQSGTDLILKRMKRRHLSIDIKRFVQSVRQYRSDICFGADVIAGFPTETDEHFEETFHLIESLRIPLLHVFPFSPRPGTPAARMPQVKAETIKARASRLRRLGHKLTHEFMHSLLGKKMQILVEKIGFGYTQHYLPAVLPDADNDKVGLVVEGTPTEIVMRGKRLCFLLQTARVIG